MAYRPYPNVGRARRQLVRGYSPEPASVAQLQAAQQAQSAREMALPSPPVDEYRLSTR